MGDAHPSDSWLFEGATFRRQWISRRSASCGQAGEPIARNGGEYFRIEEEIACLAAQTMLGTEVPDAQAFSRAHAGSEITP